MLTYADVCGRMRTDQVRAAFFENLVGVATHADVC
jgi:hypothetical protein